MAFTRRPCLIRATLLACLFIMTEAHRANHLKYTTITGFFLQDDPSTNASVFDYVSAIAMMIA